MHDAVCEGEHRVRRLNINSSRAHIPCCTRVRLKEGSSSKSMSIWDPVCSLVVGTEHEVAVQRAIGDLAGRHAVHLAGQGASAIQHLWEICRLFLAAFVLSLQAACLTLPGARQTV